MFADEVGEGVAAPFGVVVVHVNADDVVGHPQADVAGSVLGPGVTVRVGRVGALVAGVAVGRRLLGPWRQRQDAAPSGSPVGVKGGVRVGGVHHHMPSNSRTAAGDSAEGSSFCVLLISDNPGGVNAACLELGRCHK